MSPTLIDAVAVFTDSSSPTGTVVFKQVRGKGVIIDIDIKNLSPGYHGFHIHEFGDLRMSNHCDSCGPHYNPHIKLHGGLDMVNSHAGDLGNIVADQSGNVKMQIETKKFKVKDIIGRSLIIHADRDDLGKGGKTDSQTTGHSGKRIACALIGIAMDK